MKERNWVNDLWDEVFPILSFLFLSLEAEMVFLTLNATDFVRQEMANGSNKDTQGKRPLTSFDRLEAGIDCSVLQGVMRMGSPTKLMSK